MEKIHGGIHGKRRQFNFNPSEEPQTSVIDFEISAWPREVNPLKRMAWIHGVMLTFDV